MQEVGDVLDKDQDVKEEKESQDQAIKQRIITILGDDDKTKKLEDPEYTSEQLLAEPITDTLITEEDVINLIANDKIDESNYTLLLQRISTPIDYESAESIQGLLSVLQTKPELLDIIGSILEVPNNKIDIKAIRSFIGKKGYHTAYQFEKNKPFLLRDVALNLGSFDVEKEKRNFSYVLKNSYEPFVDILETALYGSEQKKWAKVLIELNDKGLQKKEKITGKETDRLSEKDKFSILHPIKARAGKLPSLEDYQPSDEAV